MPNENTNSPVEVEETTTATEYDRMCRDANNVPLLHNILASFFAWILLAGFIVSPGTFTRLRTEAQSAAGGGAIGGAVQAAVQNIPLIYVAVICCLGGAGGMYWLCRKWNRNYQWQLTHIYVPGLLNSATGLITTLINIYTAQGGNWSITAVITCVASGLCAVVFLMLYLTYTWLLNKVKEREERGGLASWMQNVLQQNNKVRVQSAREHSVIGHE